MADNEERTASYEIVYTDSDGQQLKLADLVDYDGVVHWLLVGGPEVPQEAHAMHDEGREAGAQGDYTRAHELLYQAQRLVPDWPYPLYDKAWTYALEGQLEAAEETYARVNEMVPRGFMTALAAEDILRRENRGDVPEGTFLTYTGLDWMPEERRQLAAQELIEHATTSPQVWLLAASREENPERRLELAQRGLDLRPDPDTRGHLHLVRARALLDLGLESEAVAQLHEILTDPYLTYSVEAEATLILSALGEPPEGR